jgi:propionyl-CoA carboxylase beta chain
MPQNCEEKRHDAAFHPGDEYRRNCATSSPKNANQPYDMREVIAGIVDEFFFGSPRATMPKTS